MVSGTGYNSYIKHGVSLKEAQGIFDQVHVVDQKSNRSATVSCNRLVPQSPLFRDFQIRRDSTGEFYHLVTAWKATKEEEQSYAKNI
jgi:uncharacterized DUF497 family protein